MPTFERSDVSINYEIIGEGFPVLLIAPGGMHSAYEKWMRRTRHGLDCNRRLPDGSRVAIDAHERAVLQSPSPTMADR